MKSINLNRALDIIDNAVLNFESCDIVDAFGHNRYDNERILFENNAVFAKEIFEQAGVSVNLKPCNTDEFPRPANRPAFSAMENGNLCRDWKLALKDYMKIRK